LQACLPIDPCRALSFSPRYLQRAPAHASGGPRGEAHESRVTKTRDKVAALKFIKKKSGGGRVNAVAPSCTSGHAP
jgi:hypothetical protein